MDGNSSSTLCGVELTSSQIADPYRELSTQQTCALLAQFDGDEYFLNIDADFEQLVPHVDAIISQPKTTKPSASATSAGSSTLLKSTSFREYASLKGEKAIKAAIVNSIPKRLKSRQIGQSEFGLSGLFPGTQSFCQARSHSAPRFAS